MGEVKGLEVMVRGWEDAALYVGLINRLMDIPPFGAVQNWRSFRTHLLQANVGCFDKEKYGFGYPQGVSAESTALTSLFGEKFNIHAECLFAWNKHGRRVFHLTEELCLLLANTTLNIPISEVSWALPSFAITWDGAAPNEVDTLVVSTASPQGRETSVSLVGIRSSTKSKLGEYDRKLVDETIKKNDIKAIKKRVLELGLTDPETWDVSAEQVHHPGEVRGVQAVTQLVRGMKESLNAGYREFILKNPLNIAAGLMLYLETLPPNSPHKSSWSRIISPGKPDPRAISKEAEVCHVNSQHVLSAEERQLFRDVLSREGAPLSAHFRSGHWRRPPGKGNDPDAPKLVHVRPTLVRPDRLGEGELPGGSIAHVR